ncbi:hypothetical protein ACFE04_021044 [Oxalis oulophora]
MEVVCSIDESCAAQISSLLRPPPPPLVQDYFDKLISSTKQRHVITVKHDGEFGKGVYANTDFKQGQLILKDQMLVGAQHSLNKIECMVCDHCFKFIGSIELQLGRRLYLQNLPATPVLSNTGCDGSSSSSSHVRRDRYDTDSSEDEKEKVPLPDGELSIAANLVRMLIGNCVIRYSALTKSASTTAAERTGWVFSPPMIGKSEIFSNGQKPDPSISRDWCESGIKLWDLECKLIVEDLKVDLETEAEKATGGGTNQILFHVNIYVAIYLVGLVFDSLNLVWSEPNPPPVPLKEFLYRIVLANSRDRQAVKLEFDIHTENSLNNRFKEINGLETDAVFSIDDDVIFPCSTVEFAFSVWRSAPDVMVGFVPRTHWVDESDPAYYILKEEESPCIFVEGDENGLEFTIVRPFNWIGPRMDFIPGIDGPSEGVPRVLACFSNAFLEYPMLYACFLGSPKAGTKGILEVTGIPSSVPVRVAHELHLAGHCYLDVRTPEEFSDMSMVLLMSLTCTKLIQVRKSINPEWC